MDLKRTLADFTTVIDFVSAGKVTGNVNKLLAVVNKVFAEVQITNMHVFLLSCIMIASFACARKLIEASSIYIWHHKFLKIHKKLSREVKDSSVPNEVMPKDKLL